MGKRTNMIETVGLLIGAAQSDPKYRGLSRRAGQQLVGMVFGVARQDRRENTRGVNR
jgi:hypothetical protein